MSEAKNSVVYEARTAHKLKVSAQVTDAKLDLMLKEKTEVLAERTDDPNHFTIAWPYGDSSASTVVHRSSLIFS